jgi:hypothetical protein
MPANRPRRGRLALSVTGLFVESAAACDTNSWMAPALRLLSRDRTARGRDLRKPETEEEVPAGGRNHVATSMIMFFPFFFLVEITLDRLLLLQIQGRSVSKKRKDGQFIGTCPVHPLLQSENTTHLLFSPLAVCPGPHRHTNKWARLLELEMPLN